MPKDNTPIAIRPFMFHGVDFSDVCDEQYIGICPNCLKENHFYVNKNTGQYDCKVCGVEGNIVSFLEMMHDQALEQTEHSDYIRLRKLRGIPVSAYHSAELAWNGERWLMPVRSADSSRIQDLRICYEHDCTWKATRGVKTGLWNSPELRIPRKKHLPVWICEGEWDGMSLRWLFYAVKYKAVIVAVPGSNTFKNDWIKLFNDRDVILAYDCDDAGDDGMEKVGTGKLHGNIRTVGLLASNTKSLSYVRWSNTMEVHTDMRDVITHSEGISDPSQAFRFIMGMVSHRTRRSSFPDRDDTENGTVSVRTGDIIPDTDRSVGEASGASGEILPKTSKRPTLSDIMDVYKHHIPTVTYEFEDAVKLSLVTVLAAQLNESVPIWLYMIGPPGCGKTLITGSLNDCPTTVHRSTLSPKMLLSGYQTNPDPSLLAELKDMCLVLKDFTEILEKNLTDQNEVFSILRGAYDGSAIRSFGNPTKRVYKHRFSMLAGCTSQINSISKASMGERALKFHMIGRSIEPRESGDAVKSAMYSLGKENEQRDDCTEITNSYLDHWLDHKKVYSLVPADGWAFNRIHGLAQLVAILRATVARNVYTGEILYRPETEYGTRLGKQLLKLGCLIAEVSNSGHELTHKDYGLLEQVAFDTAIGWNLDIVQAFMNLDITGKKGLTIDEITVNAKIPQTNTRKRLDDMHELDIIKRHKIVNPQPHKPKHYFILDNKIVQLWNQCEVGNKKHGKRILQARRKRFKAKRR